MNYKPGDLFQSKPVSYKDSTYNVVFQLGYSSPDGPEFYELHPMYVISSKGVKTIHAYPEYTQIKKEEIGNYEYIEQ